MQFTAISKGKSITADMGLPSLDNALAVLKELNFRFGHGDSIVIGASRFERCGQSWREYDYTCQETEVVREKKGRQMDNKSKPSKTTKPTEHTGSGLSERITVIEQAVEPVRTVVGVTAKSTAHIPATRDSGGNGDKVVSVGVGTNTNVSAIRLPDFDPPTYNQSIEESKGDFESQFRSEFGNLITWNF